MATEDELLKSLGEIARAESDDARWESLAAGRLSANEVAAIEREAEEDEHVAAMLAASRPMSDASRAKIVAGVAPLVRRSNVTPIGRRRGVSIAMAAGAIAMAAAVALAVVRARSDGDAMLPTYQLISEGGDRSARGAASPVGDEIVLRSDSRLDLTLRPATRTGAAPTVRAYLVKDGTAQPWSPPMQISPDGAVRVAGNAGELLGATAGSFTMAFAIGAEGAVPADPAVIARSVGDGHANGAWQLLVQRVRLSGAP